MSKNSVLVISLVTALAGTAGIFGSFFLSGALNKSQAEIDSFLETRTPSNYVNSSIDKTVQTSRVSDALFEIKAPEGFWLRSYSEQWNEEKLELLRQELLLNKHGAEIETLQEIVLLPEDNEEYLGSHQEQESRTSYRNEFPLFQDHLKIVFRADTSIITLNNAETNNTVERMAKTLSHEYGHLYTFYYFENNQKDWADTEYAKMRQAGLYNLRTSLDDLEDYKNNHHMYLAETAAEDYVQLMGSPNARQVVRFTDVRQVLNGASQPDPEEINSAFNAYPQENFFIPLASEVPGLREYYYSFIQEAPVAPLQEKLEFNISISPHTVGYDLVDGYKNFTSYRLAWDAPYAEATYTLVCVESGDEYAAIPIKTVYPGESANAEIGNATANRGNRVEWIYDNLASGTKTFYVVALLPDGTAYLSQPLEYTF